MQVHEVRLVRLPHPSPAAVIAWPPHPPKGICGRCAYWERFARHELILFKEVNISWLLSGCMMIDSLTSFYFVPHLNEIHYRRSLDPIFRPLLRLCWGAQRARGIKSLPTTQGRPLCRHRAVSTIARSCEKCYIVGNISVHILVVILLECGWTRCSTAVIYSLIFLCSWCPRSEIHSTHVAFRN